MTPKEKAEQIFQSIKPWVRVKGWDQHLHLTLEERKTMAYNIVSQMRYNTKKTIKWRCGKFAIISDDSKFLDEVIKEIEKL